MQYMATVIISILASSFAGLSCRLLIKNKYSQITFITLAALPIASIIGVLIRKDVYTYSGWTAIGNFNFSTLSFSYILAIYYFTFFLIVFGYMIGLIITRYVFGKTRQIFKYENKNLSNERKATNRNLFKIILGLIIVCTLMSANFNIGITGVKPVELPFSISGLVYYTERLLLPILLIVFFTRHSAAGAYMYMALGSAFILSLITMSRYQTLALLAPLIYGAYVSKHKKSEILFLIIITASIMVAIGVMRHTFFDMIDGNYVLQQRSVINVLYLLITNFSIFDIFNVIFTLANRVLGIDGIILATQTGDISSINPLQLIPLISYFAENNDAALTRITHGFTPPAGTAVGVGLFGEMTILLLNSPVYFFFAIFLTCAILILNLRLPAKLGGLSANTQGIITVALNIIFLFTVNTWYILSIISLYIFTTARRLRI